MFEPKNDLALLHPIMQGRAKCFLEECQKEGLFVKITETRRTKARQLYLWGKGRFIPKNLELQYLGYDDPNINGGEPGAKQVTWTLQSYHLNGLAFDICFIIGGKASWDGDWAKAHEIGDKCGLMRIQGDLPHFQYDPKFKD